MAKFGELMRGQYEKLLPFCETDKERRTVELCIEHGGTTKAAPYIGVNERTARKHLQLIRERAKTPRDLIGSLDEPVASPMAIKGTSTLYDAETGEAKIAWIKTDLDKQQQLEQLLETIDNAFSSYKPLKRIKAPKKVEKDKMVVLPLGDPHLGLYAWSEEAGEDFDCDIAERNLRQALAYLIDKAPPAEHCIILNLGDFFHGDNVGNTTTRGTDVDVDGRWGRVFDIGMVLMIDAVNLALSRFKKVTVRNNPGNHDRHTGQALSIAMKYIFKDNPRIEIAEPSNPYFIYEFGNNMLFSTHGDGLKPKQAQGFIANAYAEMWGRCEHRLALFGHYHHEDRKEDSGLIVEIFNTLASSDAWHHASGYRSKRNMKCIVLDREDGEIERYTFSLKRKSLCPKPS